MTYQKIIFEAKVLTPIHISGLSKKSIEEKIERINKVMNELERLGGNIEIVKKLRREYLEKVEKLAKYARDWKEFMKSEDRVIIPGSSIKGSFASAIEHYKNWRLDNDDRERAFQNIIFRDVYLSKNYLERGNIIISDRKIINDIEVLRIGTSFELVMIFKENTLLKLEEVLTYPALKNILIIDVIYRVKKDNFLLNDVKEYYIKYLNTFNKDFTIDKLDEKYKFVRENGIIIRLGKYTGLLSKATLKSFENNLNKAYNRDKYIGRLYNNRYLMGFLKLAIKRIE